MCSPKHEASDADHRLAGSRVVPTSDAHQGAQLAVHRCTRCLHLHHCPWACMAEVGQCTELWICVKGMVAMTHTISAEWHMVEQMACDWYCHSYCLMLRVFYVVD